MTTSRTRGRLTLAALTWGLGLVIAVAGVPAAAGSPAPSGQAPTYWGAIALSVDGETGLSWDYPTKAGALDRAVAECKKYSSRKKKCKSVVYTINGCAAVSAHLNAKGFVQGYAYAFGKRRKPVIRIAQRKCVDQHGTCKRLTSVCTSRP